MSIPEEVRTEIDRLQAEIESLHGARWIGADNTADSRNIRSQARSVVLAAKKVEEAARRTTYSPT